MKHPVYCKILDLITINFSLKVFGEYNELGLVVYHIGQIIGFPYLHGLGTT